MTSTMDRAQAEAVARDLRSQGLKLREIADAMGRAVSTVDAYLNDPGGHRLKARKESYRGECVVCGGPTSGCSGPDLAPELCMKCRIWSAEDCIAEIKRWAHKHGGIPPSARDWRRADTDHPNACTVAKRCGGWNAALLAAGFSLRCDRRPETQEWIEDQIRSGRPIDDVADDLGVSASNISNRLRSRGLSVRSLRCDAC